MIQNTPNKNKKRKRSTTTTLPRNFLDAESLDLVPSSLGPISTPILSESDKEFLLERFQVELIKPKSTSNHESWKQWIRVGTNQCTRSLETALDSDKPRLVWLARDVRPPTILAHIPFLCQKLGIPIVLLPGKASSDLGRLLGMKTASVILFQTPKSSLNPMERKFHAQLDSFLELALLRIPKQKKESHS